jgi:hypothetical protein
VQGEQLGVSAKIGCGISRALKPALANIAVAAQKAGTGGGLQPCAITLKADRLDINVKALHHRTHQVSLTVHSFANVRQQSHNAFLSNSMSKELQPVARSSLI